MQNLVLAVTSDFSNMTKVKEEAEKRDMRVHYIDNMREAVELLADKDYTLLAIRAGSVDYLYNLGTLREMTQIPIIIYSYEYISEVEKVEALRTGADVFIATPYALEYIIESSHALIRLYARLEGKTGLKPGSVLTYGHILLSTQTRSVFVRGGEVFLSKREFDLLHMFMNKPGRVFDYEQIIANILRSDYVDNFQKVVYNHIYQLRRKLKVTPDIPEYILTVKDVGYKLALSFDRIREENL